MTVPKGRRQPSRSSRHISKTFIKIASRCMLLFLALRILAAVVSGPTLTIYEGEETDSGTHKTSIPLTPAKKTSIQNAARVIVVEEEEPSATELLLNVNVNVNANPNASSFEKITYFTSKPDCHSLQPHQVSMTLTTQLSLDRMWIMKYQCQRWSAPHPISIAVYLPPKSDKNETYIVDQLLELEYGCDLSRMTVSILKGHEHPALREYPVNILRNMALEGVQTTHAAYIDSDFLISHDLYDHLLAGAQNVAHDPKAALVMPAFEYFTGCAFETQLEAQQCLATEFDKNDIPNTQNDLLPSLQTKYPLSRVQRGYQNKHGKNRYHSTTMYTTWELQATAATITTVPPVVRIPCTKTLNYEPYLAIRMCRDLPEFPRVFRGWGWNKVIWILLLLKKQGYSMWQIPHGFVMHLPHPESTSRTTESDQTERPPAMTQYLKWFWNALPDHLDAPPTCADWKQQQPGGKVEQTIRGYE